MDIDKVRREQARGRRLVGLLPCGHGFTAISRVHISAHRCALHVGLPLGTCTVGIAPDLGEQYMMSSAGKYQMRDLHPSTLQVACPDDPEYRK